MSQRYGGFTFTPYVMQGLFSDNNDGISSGSKAENTSGFGYSVGYQGLIMPKKRFSFSYGFQYSDFYYEFYRKPQDIGSSQLSFAIRCHGELQPYGQIYSLSAIYLPKRLV